MISVDDEIEVLPSKTYRILNGRVAGWIDNLDAIKQSIEKTLLTERFRYEIYSDRFGIELENLIGESKDLVVSEIERIVSESLLIDERIVDLENFTIADIAKENMTINFKVITIFGSFDFEKEVVI